LDLGSGAALRAEVSDLGFRSSASRWVSDLGVGGSGFAGVGAGGTTRVSAFWVVLTNSGVLGQPFGVDHGTCIYGSTSDDVEAGRSHGSDLEEPFRDRLWRRALVAVLCFVYVVV